MYGSSYSSVKAAVVTKLTARNGLSGVAVSGEPPVDPFNVQSQTGSGKAIWIADTEGDYDNVVLCGPGRLDLEETYDLKLVLQSLPLSTTDNQAVTDQRVDVMLGEVLLEMAGDPTWGLVATADLPIVYLMSTHGSFRRFVGPISDRNIRPSRCELDLNVRCRITFDPS